ncbi:MAG TPA: MarR family winged helix-turn-helix transcriptional regulator [Polyangiaceae bacterium]|jgi:DNA-binding MarR family transcriptional regulator|nr:MarR family winged helix-turn-helix transcriptional regulator [Polyangiaceae bacterium]
MVRQTRQSGQRPRTGGSAPDAAPGEFRAQLDAEKRASTLQVLFKVARLLDERALARLGMLRGQRLRRSHTQLLPHIDLDGTRMSDLAERLGVSKQAVTQLVDELESFGVVERVPDPEDARARRVRFTARGRAGFFEGLATLGELERELAQGIGEKPMAELRSALLAIHDGLESGRFG